MGFRRQLDPPDIKFQRVQPTCGVTFTAQRSTDCTQPCCPQQGGPVSKIHDSSLPPITSNYKLHDFCFIYYFEDFLKGFYITNNMIDQQYMGCAPTTLRNMF